MEELKQRILKGLAKKSMNAADLSHAIYGNCGAAAISIMRALKQLLLEGKVTRKGDEDSGVYFRESEGCEDVGKVG